MYREITELNFQVVTEGETREELKEFRRKISDAITGVLCEAPDSEKVVFRENQFSLNGVVGDNIWQILPKKPLEICGI